MTFRTKPTAMKYGDGTFEIVKRILKQSVTRVAYKETMLGIQMPKLNCDAMDEWLLERLEIHRHTERCWLHLNI